MLSFIDIMQQGALPLFFFTGLIFITGLCFGSFLNVVIYRLPIMLHRSWQQDARDMLAMEDANNDKADEHFNLAVPRSACPLCGANITAWQNIPVVSYILLRGKCHSCHAPISIRYPVVEFLTGVISVALLFKFGISWELLALLLLTYASIALFGIDLDEQILPDVITLPLVWIGLLVNTQNLFVDLHSSVYGAIFGYGVLWAVFWLFKLITGKEGMGYGDFKLLAVFGAWFGWAILPNVVLMSSLMGSVVGIWLIKIKGVDSQTPIPFGPYIIIAGWLTAICPEQFILTHFIR